MGRKTKCDGNTHVEKQTFHHAALFTNKKLVFIIFFEINKKTHAGMMQPEFMLPKISIDNDPSGFSRLILFVWLIVEFKDFDYGEKIDDETHSMQSKIWSVLVNSMEIRKSDSKHTLSDDTLEEHKKLCNKKIHNALIIKMREICTK